MSKVGFIIRIDLDARKLSMVAVEGGLAASFGCETELASLSSWAFTTFALVLDEPLEALPFFFPPDVAMMTREMSVEVGRIAGGVVARFPSMVPSYQSFKSRSVGGGRRKRHTGCWCESGNQISSLRKSRTRESDNTTYIRYPNVLAHYSQNDGFITSLWEPLGELEIDIGRSRETVSNFQLIPRGYHQCQNCIPSV